MRDIHDIQVTVTATGPRTLPAYNYSYLPENHIRVLQLLPHPDANAPVDCALINYPLLDARKGTHLYEAVSYVWGPPPNTHHLLVNGACLSVRQNCYAALVRLRDPAIPRFLWVDAVCINQDDNDEKTDQVQLMTWIYSSARGVWSGSKNLRRPGDRQMTKGEERLLKHYKSFKPPQRTRCKRPTMM